MTNLFNLISKAKWLLSGNFIFAFSQWLILIMLARMATPADLGNYSLALAIIVPIFSVMNLQLRPLYILDANGKNLYQYSNFYFLRIVTSLFALVLCLLFGFFYDHLWFVLFLVGLLKFFESYSDIIYAYYNAHDKTKLISKSLALKGIFSIITVYIGLKFFSFYIALLLFLGVYFIIWFFIDNKFLLSTKKIENLSFDLRILKSAIPMGVSLGIISLQASIPKLMIEKYHNVEMVGVFTVLTYFIIVGSIFINSICQYLSPRMTKSWFEDLNSFNRLIISGIIIAAVLGSIAILLTYFFGTYFLNIFYGPSYKIYHHEMLYIMISGIFLYLSTVVGYTLTAISFIHKQVYLFSLVLLVSLVSSYLLIPEYGLDGSIYSLIISYVFQFVLAASILLFLMKNREKKI